MLGPGRSSHRWIHPQEKEPVPDTFFQQGFSILQPGGLKMDDKETPCILFSFATDIET